MPDSVTITFSPRYSECDPDGQLYLGSYVRLMLQAGLEAGATADLGPRGFEAAGWLERIGDIGLQIQQPALYGDKLEVQTRLTRQGPPAWRREFSFQRGGTNLAVGFVDAFLEDDADSDDDEDQPAEPDASPAWDGPVPDPPEAPRRAFRAAWRASWPRVGGPLEPAALSGVLGDLDRRAAEALGWSAERDREAGVAWEISEHRLELFEPIANGDVLKLISYIGERGDDWLDRHASIVREGAEGLADELAHGRTRWVCLSAATGQRCPLPADWLLDLVDQMASE